MTKSGQFQQRPERRRAPAMIAILDALEAQRLINRFAIMNCQLYRAEVVELADTPS